jgi:hypothetical protein
VGNSPVRLEIRVGPLRPAREHLANQTDLEAHRRLWFAGRRGHLVQLHPTAVVAGGQEVWPDGTQLAYPTDAITAPHQVSLPDRRSLSVCTIMCWSQVVKLRGCCWRNRDQHSFRDVEQMLAQRRIDASQLNSLSTN